MNASIELAASVVVFKQELEQARLSIEDVIWICADYGIQALEVRDEERFGLPPTDVPAAEFNETYERLKLLSTDSDVSLIVASGASLCEEADCPRLLRAITGAKSLGSPVVRVFLSELAEWQTGENLNRNVIERLEPILEAAESSGVLLCVENTSGPEGSVNRVVNFIDQVEFQLGIVLGMTLDTGNCVMNEEEGSPAQVAKLAGGRVKYVHLKDVCPDENLNMRDCAPGSGSVNFRSVFDELKAGGYCGYACFEFDGVGEGLNWLRKALSKTRQYLT
jgi:sugar phosphate isomerase/epimerase